MAKRWPINLVTPHYVVDSAFYSAHVMDWMTRTGIFLTASVNKQHKRWIYDLLHHFTRPGSWVASMDRSNFLWSCYQSDEDEYKERRNHFVSSNAFSNDPSTEVCLTPCFSQDDQKILKRLQIGSLQLISNLLSGCVSNDPNELVNSIVLFASSKAYINHTTGTTTTTTNINNNNAKWHHRVLATTPNRVIIGRSGSSVGQTPSPSPSPSSSSSSPSTTTQRWPNLSHHQHKGDQTCPIINTTTQR